MTNLLERWRNAKPQPWTTEAVERRLRTEFQAYQIPLTAISLTDFRNDDEVREDLLYKLFTITHPDILDRLYSPEEKKMKDPGSGLYEAYWTSLFRGEAAGRKGDLTEPTLGEASWLAYSLLNIQHALGQRTSLILEREDGYVTGAKVYGMSDHLSTFLIAVTGYREFGSDDRNRYSMVTGDVHDEGYCPT